MDRTDTEVAEVVGHLVTADVGRRGTVGPIADAVGSEPPPALRAAERLVEAVDPGDTVVLLTGFPIPPAMLPETDGPIGAASIARAVDLALDASPVIACEPEAVAVCEAAATAGGLGVVDRETSAESARTVAVEAFPAERDAARSYARELADLDPAAVVSVEKAGPNGADTFHNMAGYDVSETSAKVEELYDRLDGSVPTVAVGDSGNEVGMGNVEAAVRREIEYGDDCRCGCGGGIACSIGADVLVPAAVSNWGAHAIVTCLSALLDRPLLHEPAVERRMLTRASMAGGVDGIVGGTSGSCDGLPAAAHGSVVRLLGEITGATVHDRGGGKLSR